MGDEAPCRVLLLDACGVLVGEPMGPLFSVVAASCGMRADQVQGLFRDYAREDLWSGRISTSDFWDRFASAVGRECAPRQWHTTLTESMVPLPAAQLVSSWSYRTRLGLISNHRHEWLLPVLRRHELEEHFHVLRISSLTGVVKPASEAFLHALGGFSPHSALYVDDKTANVQAARGLGIRGLRADPDGNWIGDVERWLGPESDSARVRPPVRRSDPPNHRGPLHGGR